MNRLAHEMAVIFRENSGIKCPHGCKGCAVRVFGLVKHLVEVHGYTEKEAWKKARKEAGL